MKTKLFRILIWPFKQVYNLCKWYVGLFKGRAWYTKTILSICSFIIFMLTFFGMVDINFLGLFGSSPGFWNIRNPEKHIASEIYSADGVLIGKFYNENRSPVSFNAVNPIFWKTLVDTEDERFYVHHGVDFEAILGAMKDGLLLQKPRGASTITQQLAKNLFRTRTRHNSGPLCKVPGLGMLITKTKEWIVATKLELAYSKEEILLMYANTVEFGGNIYGIKTAAKTYFDKLPKNLTADECAVLVGMLKASTAYNPRINPERSKERRNVVLGLMYEHGDITQDELAELREKPIKLSHNIETKQAGEAPYFREAVAKELEELCDEEGLDLYNDGLKIYTTLDTRLQSYAEDAALTHMKRLQVQFNEHWGKEEPWRDEHQKVMPDFIEGIAKTLPVYNELKERFKGDIDSINYYLNQKHTVKLFSYNEKNHFIEREMSTLDSIAYMVKFLHCGFVAMEPSTGHVKAWVGDVDFNAWQYDKVKAARQPGSTFKLFVYTEAMNQGLTPCDRRKDEYFSTTIWDKREHKEVVWAPGNATGRFSNDSLTLKAAFARSVNSVAVRLGQELGVDRIAETATDMGIVSTLDATPALALGASDVNLLEMTNAYSTIANYGYHVKPVLVTRVLDSEGNEIFRDKSESKKKKAVPALSAFFMQQLLRGGITEPNGTSARLNDYIGYYSDTDFGGKTGTTNNHSDGWYMCVSPNLVCGAWVGGEYRSIHFRTGALGSGSKTALPICGLFMQKVMRDRNFRAYHGHFQIPDELDLTDEMFNCETIIERHEIDSTLIEPNDSIEEETIEEPNPEEPVIEPDDEQGREPETSPLTP
ncbi:MAG: transglycosylase domain-containing protein [Bacteroidaceae bacterium]|nr:transglycosylase domain-containing protein [Bacteroidaceae bacterium]